MQDMKKSKKSVPPNIKNEASDHLKKTCQDITEWLFGVQSIKISTKLYLITRL